MQWALEIALVILLAATLFHALRLERALGVLKRDRAALEELIANFNASTRLAEQGIDRLRTAADGAGRQIARQTETAIALKDDLKFLTERGERLADQLEERVRAARGAAAGEREEEPAAASPFAADDHVSPRVRSQAERDLLRALRGGR